MSAGGQVYHVLNRAKGGTSFFWRPRNYEQFERVLAQAHARVAMPTVAYCVMPSHWHLVLWPRRGGTCRIDALADHDACAALARQQANS